MDFHYELLEETRKEIKNIRFFREDVKINAEEYEVIHDYDELDELSVTLEATAQSLAKLESSRRELLANITHDLRTPLTLINGYAEKIEDLSWEEREEARRDAAIIKRESKRLSFLVNDILDYSVL